MRRSAQDKQKKSKIGMSYRFMRVLVMFDLPTETSMERRHYRWFRKFLIDEGFVMMQESIYTKICPNMHTVERVELSVETHCPPHGIVQVIAVTERQFASMKLLVGEGDNVNVQSDERLVVL